MNFFIYAEYYLWVAFAGIFALTSLLALLDVLVRPGAQFLGSGNNSKGYWIGFTLAALVVALLCLPIGGGIGLLYIFIVFPAVITMWYFGSVRPQLPRLRRGGGGSGGGGRGPGGRGSGGRGPNNHLRGTW